MSNYCPLQKNTRLCVYAIHIRESRFKIRNKKIVCQGGDGGKFHRLHNTAAKCSEAFT